MADFSKGKQPAKSHPLRNEIHPESSEDEGVSKKSVVQVANSDVFVLETQLEEHDDYNQNHNQGSEYGEVPSSPTAFCILEHNKVEKSTEIPMPFSFGLVRPKSASSLPTAPPFKFTPRIKAANEISSKQESAHAGHTDTVAGSDEREAANDGSAISSSSSHLPRNPSNDLQQSNQKLNSVETVNKKVSTLTSIPCEASNESLVLTQLTSGTPPSTQPISRQTNGTGKLRTGRITGKVLRRGKKARIAPPRGLQWPPRTDASIGSPNQSSITVPSIQDGAFSARNSECLVTPNDAQVHGGVRFVQESKVVPDDLATQLDQPLCKEATSRHLSVDHVHTKDSSRTTPYAPSNNASEDYDVDLHTNSSNTLFKQSPNQNSGHLSQVLPKDFRMFEEQSLQASVHPFQLSQSRGEPSCISLGQLSHISSESACANASPQEAYPNPKAQVESVPGGVPTAMAQQWQQAADHDGSNSVRGSTHRQASPDAVLHHISNGVKPQRVAKLRKQMRGTNGLDSTISTIMTREQGLLTYSDIDRYLEPLKFALLEGQSHLQHEQTRDAKHFEDMRAVLQDKIDSQEAIIAELKEKRQEQDAFVVQLTDKAKTNQKYVAGLQKDYEKLQKSVSFFESENKRILQEKIAEIQSEKETLRCQFEVATDASMKSQTSMKSMLEEMYARWIISESKKKDLAENLENQKSMYEDEKKKRNNLEKQLLSSVLTIQKKLGDGFNPLTEKLVQLQSSLDSVVADDKRDNGVEECLCVLRQIQTAPSLTANDVKKAERILRFMHDNIDSKLGVLSGSLNGQSFLTEKFQTYISDQLQKLQTEILKYEEVVTKNREVLRSNDSLQIQLDAQRQYCLKLDSQVKDFRDSEAGVKAFSAQLEQVLQELKTLTRNQNSKPSELECEMTNLHYRLRQVEDDLKSANAKVEQAERLRKEQELDAQKSKRRYEDCKARLLEVDRKLKENKNESAPELRERMTQECRRVFEERESAFKNEIHSLTIERNEQNQRIQELESEMASARVRLQKERKETAALESELDSIRKEKMEVEAKLKDTQGISFSVSELENLKEQLLEKLHDVESKSQENEDLRSKVTHVQDLYDQLQVQTSQHLSVISTMRQEFDIQLREERAKAQTAFQLAQDQNIALQKEKDHLKSELAQTLDDKTKCNSMQTTISNQRDDLQRQVASIRAEKDAIDTELLRVQAELSEKLRKSENTLRTQRDDLQCQLTRSDVVLKESEAKNHRLEVKHSQQLRSYQETTEEMYKQLEKERNLKLKEARTQGAQTNHSQISDPSATSSTPLRNIHTGKMRRRANRDNRAAIDARDSLNLGNTVLEPRPTAAQFELSHSQRNDSGGFQNSRDNIGSQETRDEYDISLVDPCAEEVQKTQEIEGLPIFYDDFDETFGPVAHKKNPSQRSSSTDLSTIDSEKMAQIEQDIGLDFPLIIRGHERSVSKQRSSKADAMETTQSDGVSVADSCSSFLQDQPISRANTASRMMPPPGRVLHHFEQRNKAYGAVTKEAAKYQSYHKIRNKPENNNAKSPNSIQPQPALEQVNTHIDPRLLDCFDTEHNQLQTSQSDLSQKRQTFDSEAEQDASSKRKRVSAHPRSPQPSSASVSYSSSSSKVAFREKMLETPSSATMSRVSRRGPSSSKSNHSRGQLSSSNKAQTATSTRRASSRLTKSKTGKGMEGRFSQELGTSR